VTTAAGCEYLLRVHRPDRHGHGVESAAAVTSELEWLVALRTNTSVAVPKPVCTVAGELTTTCVVDGVDGSRVCSMLRWMSGRNRTKSARPVHLRRVGESLAQLHDHGDVWRPPDGFVRIRWDREAFFGNTLLYGQTDAADCWGLLPPNLRSDFERVAEEVGEIMRSLGEGPDVFGLIHADAHLDNVLFDDGRAGLIDFDDCGFGYRIYDLAVALWEFRHRPDYPDFRSAFIAGYTRHRPLSDEELRLIDAFIAAREVAFGLWLVGMAEQRSDFRSEVPTELGFIERNLNLVLPAGAAADDPANRDRR
jgi:Ser/Thr protein kinase RdoA (MazF antagonist)